MNFMEKGNTDGSSRDDRFYKDDVDQNHHSEMMLMTTSTSTSSGGRQGDMMDPIFSSTNWASSSSSSTTTLVSSPPNNNNLYQQYYTTTRGIGIETGTSHIPPLQLDLMDASPTPSEEVAAVEKEHMFDKVVTPSDVGKLNRLVIPKQHAEKYFPLDSSTNDKGLLLNFEDVTTGKLWRFRYSYWNSSQSYVMTKGWSRFVKEKKLDPGDIVSFHRAKAKLDRLFIDCTHRPLPVPHPQLISSSSLPFSSNIMNYSLHPARYFPGNSFQNMRYSTPTTMGWSSSSSNTGHPPPPPGLFLPSHAATPLRDGRGAGVGGDHYYHPASHNHNLRTNGYNNNYYGGGNTSYNCPSGNPVIYHRSAPTTNLPYHHQQQQQEAPSSPRSMRFSPSGSSGEIGIRGGGVNPQFEQVLLHSVPVVQGKAAAKRLRLFGVNMDCPISNNDYDIEDLTILPSTTISHHQITNASPSSLSHLVQLRLNNNSSGPSSPHHHHSQFHSD